ncbi:tyrosine-type recombinase/integrase [Saccharothrix sp. HUAS TT1]|uniref:tyrosine-type recombinase/integrase n=1 Tax=unclassified Saccharothrix TaxID=2593673 RepID=UPI00345C352E
MKPARRRLYALSDTVKKLTFPASPSPAVAELVSSWLGERYARAAATGDTYASCLAAYLRWCAVQEVDPLLVTRQQASRFVLWLADEPSAHTGRLRSVSARNTVLTACARFLEYAVEAEARPDAGRNPFLAVSRPSVQRYARQRARLTVSDVTRLVSAAREDHVLGGTLGKVLIGSLALVGVRPTDLCRLEMEHAGDDGQGGYRLDLTVKRGKQLTRWMPGQVAADLYAYLHRERVEPDEEWQEHDPLGPAPLLVHPRLRRRVNRDDVLHLVKRSASAADLPIGTALTARDFRPFFITSARAAGADLEDRQRAAGHADPRTTGIYDQTAWTREHDPALRVAAMFEDYPSEELSKPLAWARPRGPRREAKYECDCTPQWKHLRVWLGGLHRELDEYGRAVPTDLPEPGVAALDAPSCPVCHAIYLGPYRVEAIPGDPDGQLLALCRRELTDRAAYPSASARRDERRRRDGTG